LASRLVVCCMDRRLVEVLKARYDNRDSIIVSNAGANVRGLTSTISQLMSENRFSEIHIVLHEDCFALRIVTDHLLRSKRASADIYVHLVRQFEGRVKNENEHDIILENKKLQIEQIGALFKRNQQHTSSRSDVPLAVYCTVLGLRDFILPSEALLAEKRSKHLIVSTPLANNYRNLFTDSNAETYMTYAIIGGLGDIENDIEILVSTQDIADISFVIQNEGQRRIMEKYRDRIRQLIRRHEISKGREIRMVIVLQPHRTL